MRKDKKFLREYWLSWILLVILCCGVLHLTSCGRRDPVIATQESQIVDFVPEDMLEEDTGVYPDRTPLNPEFFDAYQAHLDE